MCVLCLLPLQRIVRHCFSMSEGHRQRATISQSSAIYTWRVSWHRISESCLFCHSEGGVREFGWTKLSNPSRHIQAYFEQETHFFDTCALLEKSPVLIRCWHYVHSTKQQTIVWSSSLTYFQKSIVYSKIEHSNVFACISMSGILYLVCACVCVCAWKLPLGGTL